MKAGAAVADATVSAYVAYGAMVALWVRQQQGIGQHLEIALIDSLFHLQAPLLGRYLLTADIPPRVGNGSPDYGPYNTYNPQDIERCYALECNVYLTKPVAYAQCSEAIRQLGLFLAVVQVPSGSR